MLIRLARSAHIRKAGVTLPELLVAASIMIIVLGIALPFLVTMHLAWQDNEDRATALDGARAAAVFIAKGVRQARRFSNVPSASDPHGSLEVELRTPDGDLHQYRYYFDSDGAPPGLGWVRLLDTDLASGEMTDARLAGPVQSLSFDMRRADGVTAAAHPWEAQLVRISTSGATGEGDATFPVVASTVKRRGPVLCALFCAGNLSLADKTSVTGDVYSGGDLVIGSQASVTDGVAYAAGSVVGNGAIAGVSPTPPPSMPTLDQSYYSDLLAIAQSAPNADLDRNAEQLLLNGATLNIHGYVKLRGTAELVGPGTLVVTGNFSVSDTARVIGGAHVVVGRGVTFADSGQMVDGELVYGTDFIQLEALASVAADMVTPSDVYIESGASVTGVLYAGAGAWITGTVRGVTYIGSDLGISGATFEADVGLVHHTVPGLELLY